MSRDEALEILRVSRVMLAKNATATQGDFIRAVDAMCALAASAPVPRQADATPEERTVFTIDDYRALLHLKETIQARRRLESDNAKQQREIARLRNMIGLTDEDGKVGR